MSFPTILIDAKAITAIEHAKKLLVNTLKFDLGDKLYFANKVHMIDNIPTLTAMKPNISSTASITFVII